MPEGFTYQHILRILVYNFGNTGKIYIPNYKFGFGSLKIYILASTVGNTQKGLHSSLKFW